MYKKRPRLLLLLVHLFSLSTACAPPSIGDMNCQASDVDTVPPFLLLKEESAIPASAPFPERMTNYHRAALAEYQLSYTDALCIIRMYDGAETADAAWKLLCLESQGVEVAEDYGDAACGFEIEGIKEVHFRQGTAVVTVREDAGGWHVSTWAEAVNGRLVD